MKGNSWSSNSCAYLLDCRVWYPKITALMIQSASPLTNPVSSPPVRRPTPIIAQIDAGHVNHGTFWPLAPTKSGTLNTVKVEVSAPFAEVVPSKPTICRKYPTARMVPKCVAPRSISPALPPLAPFTMNGISGVVATAKRRNICVKSSTPASATCLITTWFDPKRREATFIKTTPLTKGEMLSYQLVNFSDRGFLVSTANAESVTDAFSLLLFEKLSLSF
mmetsp:Transcript_8648/g.32378  ORF Transcript_8648/g.32378 Transcript_8648/m.32378 type:complete len:220 (+) Transcript_8648:5293-5952(+)